MDYSCTYGSGCWCHDDIRSIDYHSRTYADDWYLKGLLIGNLIGFGIIFLQKWTGLIKLDPQTYYVSTVPVEVNLPLIIALNLATLLVCVAVLIAPSYLISRIHPAKSMHYE